MATLTLTRSGTGPPLVLLHGIGMARPAWDPVVAALAERFDVIAPDLPGFGGSDPVPAGVEPTPRALAGFVADLLDELGVVAPHVAGNSLGGWVALELAALRPVASLTLLSPAGLWRGRTPLYNLVSLRTTRWLARHAPATSSRLVERRIGRILVLGQSHGRPAQITPHDARTAIRAMGSCPGFEATLDATANRCYVAEARIDAPVTVAFGSRDWILRRRSRYLDELPLGTRLGSLPGCGHVPMGDDPGTVAGLITATTARAVTARRGELSTDAARC
jgi:pimeloyl-ACP methyl ester carboxylesterase